MRTRALLSAVVVVVLGIGIGCSPRTAPVPQAATGLNRARMVEPVASHFHRPVSLQIGWRNYRESEVVRDDDGNMVMLPVDSLESQVPAIMVGDPLAEDAVWIGMDIDDALLGRLIKHTLMTQQPIQRPLETYVQTATCAPCHPGDKVSLDEWWEN